MGIPATGAPLEARNPDTARAFDQILREMVPADGGLRTHRFEFIRQQTVDAIRTDTMVYMRTPPKAFCKQTVAFLASAALVVYADQGSAIVVQLPGIRDCEMVSVYMTACVDAYSERTGKDHILRGTPRGFLYRLRKDNTVVNEVYILPADPGAVVIHTPLSMVFLVDPKRSMQRFFVEAIFSTFRNSCPVLVALAEKTEENDRLARRCVPDEQYTEADRDEIRLVDMPPRETVPLPPWNPPPLPLCD